MHRGEQTGVWAGSGALRTGSRWGSLSFRRWPRECGDRRRGDGPGARGGRGEAAAACGVYRDGLRCSPRTNYDEVAGGVGAPLWPGDETLLPLNIVSVRLWPCPTLWAKVSVWEDEATGMGEGSW